MTQDDVTQMKVNQQSVGMIGLKQVMEEMAAEWAHRSDSDVRAELIRGVSRKNYIPEHAKDAYGKALFRELNKVLGRPCEGLERDVVEVAAEMSLAAAIEHVRDMKVIARYGVMGTPALVVNGKVVSVGTVPSKTRIRGWLREGVWCWNK